MSLYHLQIYPKVILRCSQSCDPLLWAVALTYLSSLHFLSPLRVLLIILGFIPSVRVQLAGQLSPVGVIPFLNVGDKTWPYQLS